MVSRKHIFDDIQPYVCFYENCTFGSKPFGTREHWTDHLVLEHKLAGSENYFNCPLCQQSVSGRGAISGHLARHMVEIALSVIPCGESEANSETTSLHEVEVPRCVCGQDDAPIKNSFFIQCDTCKVWQHSVCLRMTEEVTPEEYFCEMCRPDLHAVVKGPK